MQEKNLFSIVMTTYNNNDFTRCSVWAIRQFFPEVEIILVDGGTSDENMPALKKIASESNSELIILYKQNTEVCRNAGVEIIKNKQKFVLFMDNDTKILSDEAVFSCIETLEKFPKAAQTGAYAIKIIDKKDRKGYVSKEFSDHMEVTGFSAYFSMHKIEYYKKVGGMKTEEFLYDIPEKLWRGKRLITYTGDFNIGNYYIKDGLVNMSPNKKLPLIHWGKAYRAISEDLVSDWWYKNVNHIRCNPLNNWSEMEKKCDR